MPMLPSSSSFTFSIRFFNAMAMTVMSVMVLVSSSLLSVQAFQQPPLRTTTAFPTAPIATNKNIFRKIPYHSATATATATALNVKFRLDNDDDDHYEFETTSPTSPKQNQKEQQQQQQQNQQQSQPNENENEPLFENKGPQTTFGAEAVPEAQRPANEYMELLNSPLFGWANREGGDGEGADAALALRLSILYVVLFGLVCWPISGATFTSRGYELHQFFSSNIGALGFVLVIVLRLYTGWGYVGSRLQSKEIEYEETGWYDGDIELKTDAEIARDLFLYRQDVKPVVERLQKFAIAVGSLWIASCIGLNVMFNVKPMFNEYDPEMLKTLNYDDKRAGVAAEQSNGRPTYCDSRYYRAVANGGQGC